MHEINNKVPGYIKGDILLGNKKQFRYNKLYKKEYPYYIDLPEKSIGI